MIYDLIIIGTGPAGMTAAIYAARRKINFLIIGLALGGQMTWSSDVGNYPGCRIMTGVELTQKFQENLKDYNIQTKEEEVYDIRKKAKNFIVKTKDNQYETKSIIIASGKSPRKLNVPGEEKFLGKGISYCAVCDAPLHKNKIVAVIGGGNSALDSAIMLSKYAKELYLIDINSKLGGEPHLKDSVLKNKQIKIISSAKTTAITGDKFVNGLKYLKDNKEQTLNIDGIFIEVGLVTNCGFAKIVKRNKWGEIMIFRSTRTNDENLTSVPGIFAAGDVTDIPAKQIIVAAGEGSKAALACFDYLEKIKNKK